MPQDWLSTQYKSHVLITYQQFGQDQMLPNMMQ